MKCPALARPDQAMEGAIERGGSVSVPRGDAALNDLQIRSQEPLGRWIDPHSFAEAVEDDRGRVARLERLQRRLDPRETESADEFRRAAKLAGKRCEAVNLALLERPLFDAALDG
jgi:hypothetical protein